MTRAAFSGIAQDRAGNGLNGAQITFRAGTEANSPLASVYAAASGGSPLTQPIATDADGRLTVYLPGGEIYRVSGLGEGGGGVSFWQAPLSEAAVAAAISEAEGLRDATQLAALSTGYQPDIATAEAALVDGDVFFLIDADDAVYYQMVAGSAVAIDTLRVPLRTGLDSVAEKAIALENSLIPFAHKFHRTAFLTVSPFNSTALPIGAAAGFRTGLQFAPGQNGANALIRIDERIADTARRPLAFAGATVTVEMQFVVSDVLTPTITSFAQVIRTDDDGVDTTVALTLPSSIGGEASTTTARLDRSERIGNILYFTYSFVLTGTETWIRPNVRPSGAAAVGTETINYLTHRISIAASDETATHSIQEQALAATMNRFRALSFLDAQADAASQITAALGDTVFPDDRLLAADGTGDFEDVFSSYNTIFNVTGGVGEGTALRPNRIRIAPGVYPHGEPGGQIAIFPRHVVWQGRQRHNTIVERTEPLDADAAVLNSRSVYLLWNTSTFMEHTVRMNGGGRYAIHVDGGGVVDQEFKFLDMIVEHSGNHLHEAWRQANNPGGAAWAPRNRPYGIGTYSGQKFLMEGGAARGYEYGVGGHDNEDFEKPSEIACRNIAITLTGSTDIKRAFIANAFNARQPCRWIMDRVTTNGDIEITTTPRASQDDADVLKNTMIFEVSGCSDMAVWVRDTVVEGLRIRSADVTDNSLVEIVGGDDAAIAALLGSWKRTPSGAGIASSIIGRWNIVTYGAYNQNLAARLGDRTGTPWQIILSFEGGADVTIDLDQNYTGMSNEAIIAAMQADIGAAGVIDSFSSAERYRPAMLSEEVERLNLSAVSIPWRMVVAAGAAGLDTIQLATSADDPDWQIAGVAWGGDIYKGRVGRVRASGLFTTRDLMITDGDETSPSPVTPSVGDRLSIDPLRPGWLIVSSVNPVFRCIRPGVMVRV